VTRALFERYPALSEELPHVALGTLPTPVEPLPGFGCDLYVKRDDLSGEPYGGNKVRKLEFLLAEALDAGAAETLTFGAAGSNHALATAVYASRLGMHPISVLVDQPNAAYVRRNLLAQAALGAELHRAADFDARLRVAAEVRAARRSAGRPQPHIIPMGGTCAASTAGFVNAAFELAAQVDAGLAPIPDRVYVPLGSMGTAAGLALGFAALRWPTVVVAVRVIPEVVAGRDRLDALLGETAALLHGADATFPALGSAECRVDIRDEFFGEEYARFTEEGMAAVRRAGEAGLRLEGTYTGKTFAALLADAEEGALDGEHVLFWDTYDSHDVAALGAGADPQALPEAFHHFFTEPPQPLDV
jgi:1-aminocyclopropane-1-carboxylate deaminase/D-cysteine desulfhydrase-like pyridoxal-dependent ACC family enzyme